MLLGRMSPHPRFFVIEAAFGPDGPTYRLADRRRVRTLTAGDDRAAPGDVPSAL